MVFFTGPLTRRSRADSAHAAITIAHEEVKLMGFAKFLPNRPNHEAFTTHTGDGVNLRLVYEYDYQE